MEFQFCCCLKQKSTSSEFYIILTEIISGGGHIIPGGVNTFCPPRHCPAQEPVLFIASAHHAHCGFCRQVWQFVMARHWKVSTKRHKQRSHLYSKDPTVLRDYSRLRLMGSLFNGATFGGTRIALTHIS